MRDYKHIGEHYCWTYSTRDVKECIERNDFYKEIRKKLMLKKSKKK